MAQKNAAPTKEQKAVLERNKLNPLCWVVVNETPHSLIIKGRVTGEFRLINK